MRWRLLWCVLLLPLVLFHGVAGYAQSREIHALGLDELVKDSEVIFVGKVATLDQPSPEIPGVGRFAVIDVERVLKGSVRERVNFIMEGPISELNPHCCEVGSTSLFFVRHGYEIFELNGMDVSISTKGQEKYVSATNGRFSTFLIEDGMVVGWIADACCGKHTSAVVEDVAVCIERLVQMAGGNSSATFE